MDLRSAGSKYGTSWMERGQSLVGLAVLLMFCWLFSTNRKNIPWRIVGWGLAFS